MEIPGSAMEVTLTTTDDVWLVFISARARGAGLGTMENPEELLVRLLVDDRELALFSGVGSTSWASIHGVHWITDTAETVTLSAQMRSNVSRAEIEDLRIVAAPLPPEADFQHIEAPAEVIVGTTDEPVVSLELAVTDPSRYLVLASGSATERPNLSTVYVHVVDEATGDSWPAQELVNGRDPYRAISILRPAFVTTPSRTFTMLARSGGEATEATVVHPRIAAFRPSALPAFFAVFNSSPPDSDSEMPVTLARLEVPDTVAASQYVTWQSTVSNLQTADRDPVPVQFLRDGEVVSAPQNLQIQDGGRNITGFVDLVEPAGAMTLENVVAPSSVRVRSLDASIYAFGF